MAPVGLIRTIDRVGGILLCPFFAIYKAIASSKVEKPSRIAVIQLWGMGETIIAMPAMHELKKKYPQAKIDLFTTSRVSSLFDHDSCFDNVKIVGVDLFSVLRTISDNAQKYDLVIDFEEYLNISSIMAALIGKSSIGYSHGIRSILYNQTVLYKDTQHVVQTFCALIDEQLEKNPPKKLVQLKYTPKDREYVADFLKKNNVKKGAIVGIAPGAAESGQSRMWPRQRFALLADEIVTNYEATVIFTGTRQEWGMCQQVHRQMRKKDHAVNSAGAFSFAQLAAFVARCDVFIGNDSGPMHLAAAQGVKTIGLFGPNLPTRFGPYGDGNVGIYKGDTCEYSPCINVHKGQVPDCLYPKKSSNYQKCMKNIEVEDVFAEVKKAI